VRIVSDEERPVAYTAVDRGTPVFLGSGERLGTVEQVLEDPKGGIFLGLLVATRHASKFVARDRIERMTTTKIECALTADEASALPDAPVKGRGPFRTINKKGRHR
jgi:hypothetical protein